MPISCMVWWSCTAQEGLLGTRPALEVYTTCFTPARFAAAMASRAHEQAASLFSGPRHASDVLSVYRSFCAPSGGDAVEAGP